MVRPPSKQSLSMLHRIAKTWHENPPQHAHTPVKYHKNTNVHHMRMRSANPRLPTASQLADRSFPLCMQHGHSSLKYAPSDHTRTRNRSAHKHIHETETPWYRHIHSRTRAENHLKHGGRMQLGLFLKVPAPRDR